MKNFEIITKRIIKSVAEQSLEDAIFIESENYCFTLAELSSLIDTTNERFMYLSRRAARWASPRYAADAADIAEKLKELSAAMVELTK